jgi:hypothetical protein
MPPGATRPSELALADSSPADKTAGAKARSRDDVFGGLRSSIRLGGSKPYRADSYRLTPESTGLRGEHVIIAWNRLWFAKGQKTGFQKGRCLGLGE